MTEKENAKLPEVETAAKPTALLETATLISLAVGVLSIFLFAWIAENVSRDRTQAFDSTWRQRVHSISSPRLTVTMETISFIGGDGLTISAFFAFTVFLGLRWRRAALWLLTTIAGALVLDLSLKYAFNRPRPVPFFGLSPHTPSFPSGHALFSFCFYSVLAGLIAARAKTHSLRIAIWTLAVFLVLAIGFSRIYLGVHYPSDVIAGYLTGTIWVSTMVALDRVRKHRKARTGSELSRNLDYK